MSKYHGVFQANHADDGSSSDDESFASASQSPIDRRRSLESKSSTTNEQSTALKWICVASATEAEMSEDQLKGFQRWYREMLNKQAEMHQHTFQLEKDPVQEYRCEPSNKDSYQRIYESIHYKHPNVMIVIHVLPHNKANPALTDKDHTWMKALTQSFGIISQGMRIDNAIKQSFPENSANAAFSNMSSYLSHSIHEMALFKIRSNKGQANATIKAIDVRINIQNDHCKQEDENENKENNSEAHRRASPVPPKATTPAINYTIHTNDVTDAVWRSLHNYVAWHPFRLFSDPHHGYDESRCKTDAWLTMRLIPEHVRSVFRVAAYFGDYDVRNIYFAPPENDIDRQEMMLTKTKNARVCLGSRWQVVHAIENLKSKLFGEHEIILQAYHPRAIDAVNTALKFDARKGIYQKLSDQAAFQKSLIS